MHPPARAGRGRRALVACLISILVAVIAAAPARAAGRCGDHPWCDTSLSPDDRAAVLLDALTRDEKISLLAGDSLFGGFSAFPFGYGLSYTNFGYGGMRVARGQNGSTAVSVTVRNTGSRPGTDVPQLYLGLPQPSPDVVQPPRELKGFQKVSLAPGESQRVTFQITPRDLSYWSTGANGWRIAQGCYRVAVGRSSRDLVGQTTLAVGGASCPGAAASVSPSSPPVSASAATISAPPAS